MSISVVRDFIKSDSKYAEYAIVTLSTIENTATKNNESYYLELGDDEVSFTLDQSNLLLETKNRVTRYIEEKKDFIVFDYVTKKVYSASPLEDFITIGLPQHGYSCECIQKDKVQEVLDKALPGATPVPANLQGKCCCVLL
jgi:hypothetical protein